MTILTIPDNKWYQNHTPYIEPFPDTHVIAHIPADTITYEEPTIPRELIKPRVEPSTIHILYVHHSNNNVGNIEQINAFNTIFDNLRIPLVHTQIAPPTPPNIQINKSKKWNTITYPIRNLHQNNETPPLPDYETNKPLKFLPQYCYYTNGSFLPPQQSDDSWTREKARYGVCNHTKNIEPTIRLLDLQNSFRTELMAIHATLKIISKEYSN